MAYHQGAKFSIEFIYNITWTIWLKKKLLHISWFWINHPNLMFLRENQFVQIITEVMSITKKNFFFGDTAVVISTFVCYCFILLNGYNLGRNNTRIRRKNSFWNSICTGDIVVSTWLFLVLISLFIINAVIIEISLYTYHGSTKRAKSWPTRSPTVETCQSYIRQPAGYISTLYSALTFLGA